MLILNSKLINIICTTYYLGLYKAGDRYIFAAYGRLKFNETHNYPFLDGLQPECENSYDWILRERSELINA